MLPMLSLTLRVRFAYHHTEVYFEPKQHCISLHKLNSEDVYTSHFPYLDMCREHNAGFLICGSVYPIFWYCKSVEKIVDEAELIDQIPFKYPSQIFTKVVPS